MSRLLRIAFAVVATVSANAAAPDAPTKETLTQAIADGFSKLDERYWSPTLGIWFDRPGDDLRAHFEGRLNPPWWPSANAVETLLDAATATGDTRYRTTAETLYSLNRDFKDKAPRLAAELKRRQQWSEADEARMNRRSVRAEKSESVYYTEFRNEYLDDSGWWGIAWLKMYDHTRAEKYLVTAKAIHAHMAKNWRPEKGGGVMWCEDADKLVPNAITNNLFAILSARLYERTKEPEYLKWAERTLEWVRSNKLYDGSAIVDAPGHSGDYWCTNQGTYIGVLTALFQATNNASYLDEAAHFADTALTKAGLTTDDGVLIEKLGVSGDASLFKGVFARYLAQLRDILHSRKMHSGTTEKIDRVLNASASAILRYAAAGDGFYSAEWHDGAKEKATGFNAQISAMAAFVAAIPHAQQ